MIGLALSNRGEPVESPTVAAVPVAPAPRPTAPATAVAGLLEPDDFDTVAEIWADLSTADQLEKLHDDEQKWRQKLRDANVLSGRAAPVSTTVEPR